MAASVSAADVFSAACVKTGASLAGMLHEAMMKAIAAANAVTRNVLR